MTVTRKQLEMSLVPLYKGELMYIEMMDKVTRLGFVLVSIEPGFTSPVTDQVLQFDGIFHRLSESQQ